jgi:hypothetical protein
MCAALPSWANDRPRFRSPEMESILSTAFPIKRRRKPQRLSGAPPARRPRIGRALPPEASHVWLRLVSWIDADLKVRALLTSAYTTPPLSTWSAPAHDNTVLRRQLSHPASIPHCRNRGSACSENAFVFARPAQWAHCWPDDCLRWPPPAGRWEHRICHAAAVEVS